MSLKNYLWVERYRPRTLDDMCMPERIRTMFRDVDAFPNLMLSGSAGIGKTTLARILSKGHSVLEINASLNNGVDYIRDTVTTYCSTASMKHSIKIVIMDESDSLSENAQKALRGTIEKFHAVARFIFTCNYPEKILDPIRSRLTHIDLSYTKDEEKEHKMACARRLKYICAQEGATIDAEAIFYVMKRNYPDMRSCVQMLHAAYMVSPEITVDSLGRAAVSEAGDGAEELYRTILEKSTPPEIYSFVKGYFANRERDAFAMLGLPFMEYLAAMPNMPAGAEFAPSIVHKYSYESAGCIDKLVSLLACCYELSRKLHES